MTTLVNSQFILIENVNSTMITVSFISSQIHMILSLAIVTTEFHYHNLLI